MSGYDFFRVNWGWPSEVERWLNNRVKGKTVLNFPCGSSLIGTVRADIDPNVKPDIICSLDYPPFRERSFDAVICDPPFRKFNKWRWLFDVARLAKYDFILCTPNIAPNFKGWKPVLYFAKRKNTTFIRIFAHYKPKVVNTTINDFVKCKILKCQKEPRTPRYHKPKLAKK